jgi:hypothetical protein
LRHAPVGDGFVDLIQFERLDKLVKRELPCGVEGELFGAKALRGAVAINDAEIEHMNGIDPEI